MKKAALYLILFTLIFPGAARAEEKSAEENGDVKQSFTQSVNEKVVNFTDTIETWRKKKSVDFKASMEKVEAKRAEKKDAKPVDKVLTMLHIYGLAALLFVFSLQFVFYTAAILIALSILRRVFGFVFGYFRRDNA